MTILRRMNSLILLCSLVLTYESFRVVEALDCTGVVCPRLSSCLHPRRQYVPPGQCCARCDCSNYSGSLQHGYSWPWNADGTKKCEMYKCVDKQETLQGNLLCPRAEEFKNCAKPIYNFYCGCIVQCNAGGDTPYRPTFPPIPEGR